MSKERITTKEVRMTRGDAKEWLKLKSNETLLCNDRRSEDVNDKNIMLNFTIEVKENE